MNPWITAAEDLLTHRRHMLSPKGRKWLEGELRRLNRAASATQKSGVSGAIEAPLGAPDVSEKGPGINQ